MIEGQLIVLEGVDGAGTTTHAKLLADWFRGRGLPVHATREPSDGPVGVLLRLMLTGRVVVPGLHGPRPPGWTTMALLFAADRADHVEAEVMPNLMDGVTVISDRYDYSSVAYQALAAGGDGDRVRWVRELNRFARRPDLTIVLDLPPDVSKKRRKSRSGRDDIYDDDDVQSELGRFYREIGAHFPNDRIVHVNSDRPVDVVAAEIQHHVRAARNE